MSTEEKLEELNGLEKGEQIVDICCNQSWNYML